MTKIKYTVKGSDPEKARAAGSFESPKPGIYRFKIIEANVGFSKNGSGEPDKNRPRLEVVYSCLDARYPGAQIWKYMPLPGSDAWGDVIEQQWDQLLQAVAFTDGKKNREGELDTDKVLKGKTVRVRVRPGKNQDGQYRGEFGSVFPDDEDGSDDVLDGEADELEVNDWDDRQRELAQMSADDLKSIARELKEAGWEITIGGTKSSLVDKILAIEQADTDKGEVVDDDEILEDEEVLDDDDYLTEEQLKAMDNATLKETAGQFDVPFKGTKSGVISAILEAQAAPEDVLDDDEAPF